MDTRSFRILSLCAGYGGFDLGLLLAQRYAQTVCYVENEAYLCELLACRMGEGCLAPAPIWTDLRTFDGRPWRRKVHCIAAGYPCQGFSRAGRLLGESDPRHLWPHVRRVIGEVQPAFCFLENVANHLRRGFQSVYTDLCGLGYRVAAGIFTAEEVGATHRRERLFVLGWSGEACWPSFEVGDPHREGLEGRQLCDGERADERPTWPPGPKAGAQWQAILEREPGLEPAVCRVGDGPADRLDRIRALGNGVVPLVAAYAFRVLADALGCGVCSGQ